MAFLNVKTKEERQAIDFWDEYYKALLNADEVDTNESDEEIAARRSRLEADPEAWFKYYFAKYCTAEPADFHKRSTKRVLNNPEWYEVRPWSRELSKTGRTMMEILYLALTGQKKFIITVSATQDAAIKLLKPYRLAFEKNPRLRHDYGDQVSYGAWREDSFTIAKGAMFIAVGAGNAPRGARNEEIRPDTIIVDDFDTDEDCRNPDTVQKKWEWFEQAVYGTRSISASLLVIFNGNIIAEDSCIKRAMTIADFFEIVNIRDQHGKSTWASKNSEAQIDRVLKKISKASAQKEYFNNPIILGKVFEKLRYGKMQPLRKYKFLIAYTDPSYKKNGDTKATMLVGKYKNQYHIIKVYCAKTGIDDMIQWQYDILNFVQQETAIYFFIEWPAIDEPIKLSIKRLNKKHNRALRLKADGRTKPEKFYRIESRLEPLNSAGDLVFNEELKGSPYMEETEFQFLALSPKSRAHDDAPDAVEGAVYIIDQKIRVDAPPPKIYPRKRNTKRI